MRDIGRRIQRYRLSRYGTPRGTLARPPRWVWIAAVLWLGWVGFVSEHSLYRIWRMSAENARAQRQLEEARREVARFDQEARDPKTKLRDAERALRHEGFARHGEIIYRIEGGRADTLAR
jgi:cell division protein FtsB